MTYDKIIFLDVDGVLNHQKTPQRHGDFIGIDPHMVLLLHRILDKTGAQVVISSAWRLHKESLDAVVAVVKPFEVVGQTPDIPQGIRGDEVNAWLVEHKVGRYAILDDWSDFHKGQPLFKTSFATGLTEEVAAEVIAHFLSK